MLKLSLSCRLYVAVCLVHHFTLTLCAVHCCEGLRTLCIATTTIPADFYESWKTVYYKASTAIHDREKKLEEAAELIEKVSNVISQLLPGHFVCY